MKKTINLKKTIMTVALVTMVMCATACSKNEEPKKTTATNGDVTQEGNSNNNNNGNNSVTEPTTEESKVQIKPVKEEEAYVDFDGVKLPIDISWEEFKTFVIANNWEFKSSEDKFPSESKLRGNAKVKTNCGLVTIYFMPDRYETKSVLEDIQIQYESLTKPVSFCGITCTSKLEELDNVLEVEIESNYSKSYYIDEYLVVSMSETDGDYYNMSVSRYNYNRRPVDIIEYIEHINKEEHLGEAIIADAKQVTGQELVLRDVLTITIPDEWVKVDEDYMKYCYNYLEKSSSLDSYIGFKIVYNQIGYEKTVVDFTKDVKTSLEFYNDYGMLPTEISEVKIGDIWGYKYYRENKANAASDVTEYVLYAYGHKVTVSIDCFDNIKPELKEAAYATIVDIIGSIKQVQ